MLDGCVAVLSRSSEPSFTPEHTGEPSVTRHGTAASEGALCPHPSRGTPLHRRLFSQSLGTSAEPL